MGNKYLEKIAEWSDRQKAIAEGTGGVAIASGAQQRLLGYHKVYHGTTSKAAKSIKEFGLDPYFGGSGAAKLNDYYKRNSMGKIHVTKSIPIAGMMSGFAGALKEDRPSIVSAKLPHTLWENMKVDPDMGLGIGSKYKGATSTEPIASKYINGGKGSKGTSEFLNKEHLRSYYSSGSGKARALRGVGMAATGAGLLMHAKKLYEEGKKK